MHVFWDTILRPILELLRPRTIVEIGVESGKTTELLLSFCAETDAMLHCIDPHPLIDEAEWKEQWKNRWTLHRDSSLDVLPTLPSFDAILIDGDHNWYTVLHELQIIYKHAQENDTLPILFLHDIDAPYGRRDRYDNPDNIPTDARQPWERSSINGLNPDTCHAIKEGGPQNGVRTAIEDFMRERNQEYAFFEIHGFFGLGILVPRALLDNHKPLRELLASLSTSVLLQAHIKKLEQERIALLPLGHTLESALRENVKLHRKSDELRLANDQIALHLSEASAALHHLHCTRSWRWTGWMRRIGKRMGRRKM